MAQLILSLLTPGSLMLSWHLGLFVAIPSSPCPIVKKFCSYSWPYIFYPSVLSYHNLHLYSSPHPLFLPSPSQPLHPICILFSILRMTETSTLWFSFFLSFIWSVNYIRGILCFWTNIHLSVTAHHVCSFMTSLLYSGWYFLVPSFCLRISWNNFF